MNKTCWLLSLLSSFVSSLRLHAGQLAVNERFAKLSGSHMWLKRTWQVESDLPNTFSSQRKKLPTKVWHWGGFLIFILFVFFLFSTCQCLSLADKMRRVSQVCRVETENRRCGQFCDPRREPVELWPKKHAWCFNANSGVWWHYTLGSNAARFVWSQSKKK